jgi:hypothetical protein
LVLLFLNVEYMVLIWCKHVVLFGDLATPLPPPCCYVSSTIISDILSAAAAAAAAATETASAARFWAP